ncbi:hypothetical protein BDY24DRAFT_404731 [Mrakia frigida]|uniref:uncharacterized protein n=1 Tax=Mrakia frigida TaxID=29902 RepID=UPI003FCC0E58
MELAFDQVHISISGHSPRSSSPPPAHVPAQAPPSPSFSITTHSTSLYHSCTSSLLGSSTSTSSSSTLTLTSSNPLLPCCLANRLVLPYHLRSNELGIDLNRSGSDTMSEVDDEDTLRRAGDDQKQGGGGSGSNETTREKEENASKKVSPPYVRDWSPSSGDSPAFAIGDNPFEGKAREKLISRGIVPWKSLDPQALGESRQGNDGDEEQQLSPLSTIGHSDSGRDSTNSPSSPTLRYSLKPDSSPSASSLQSSRTRTPSPLQFTSTNTPSNHSNNSSLSSTYSQTSFVARSIGSSLSIRSDDERTERDDDDSSPASPLPTPSLPTSPLPDGLRYASKMEEKRSLPMSPPLSSDTLAQTAGSPYGAFSWDRGGPESPEGGMDWLWRRGEASSGDRSWAEDDGRSEADTSGGYLGEGEVSFASSDGSFDPLASPTAARFSSFNRTMGETPPQSPTYRRGSDLEDRVVEASSSDSEDPSSLARPPTRRTFVRSPGAPSPSPNQSNTTIDYVLSPTPTSSTPHLRTKALIHSTATPSSPSSPFSASYPRPLSRPLPPIPQPRLHQTTTPISTAVRVKPRTSGGGGGGGGGARPRSMHKPEIHRTLSSTPVTSSSSGLFIPHSLTPIEGSPSSLYAQRTPPTTNKNGESFVLRRSTLLVGTGSNGSPLAKRRADVPSSLVGEREREGWGM